MDLLPNVRKGFDARKTCASPFILFYFYFQKMLILTVGVVVRKAVFGMLAAKRFSGITQDKQAHMSPAQRKLAKDVEDSKEASEQEKIDEVWHCSSLYELFSILLFQNFAVRKHDSQESAHANGDGSHKDGTSPVARQFAETQLSDK